MGSDIMKIWELIPIKTDEEYAYFMSNNKDYQGMIRIPKDEESNLEDAVKSGLSVKEWEMRLC